MHLRRLSIAVLAMSAWAAALAAAQDTVSAGQATSAVRVVQERATIWRRNPSLVLAVVRQGEVLRAISREGLWYEVVVPESAGGKGEHGWIYSGHVQLVEGTPEPPARRRAAPATSDWGTDAPGASRGPRQAVPQPAFGVRGFGMFTYMNFQAKDSFDAVLGGAGHPLYGAGAEVILWKRLFVSGSWQRMKETGQRVIVFDGEVFPLGIEDTIEITPITISAGWRFPTTDRIVPYVGGGAGSYGFKETSEFADPDEEVDERFTSYHALAGVEYAATTWLFAAFEVQYTGVPDALGAPGVSADFDESNLGGFSLAVKVSVGR